MAYITEPYNLQCKDSVSGIKEVYISTYTNIPRSQITIFDNRLVNFPEIITYKFEGLKNASFTESLSLSDSGEAYDQTLNLTFSKIGGVYNFTPIIKNYTRAVVLDNNGIYHYLGLYKGLEATAFSKATGSSKQELNGYTLTLTGKEKYEAPYSDIFPINSVNFNFINGNNFTTISGNNLNFIQ